MGVVVEEATRSADLPQGHLCWARGTVIRRIPDHMRQVVSVDRPGTPTNLVRIKGKIKKKMKHGIVV